MSSMDDNINVKAGKQHELMNHGIVRTHVINWFHGFTHPSIVVIGITVRHSCHAHSVSLVVLFLACAMQWSTRDMFVCSQ
mmetsp:Transcript_23753/g.66335  ORF Transcript_23753/g.66335 Transcript_23753/m.66335 type:complete len:80 (+) Transcript_23753:315-554(+)